MTEVPAARTASMRKRISSSTNFDELRRTSDASDSAFVAMWFDDVTADYRTAAVAAVRYCRYRPIVIDQEEYTGFVMDEVVASIKRAQFVIADFTALPELDETANAKVARGSRGGVYWEAGLAYGLAKPVIHTCRDDISARRRTHFDVEQYNTIFWKDDDLNPEIRERVEGRPRLAERLVARIFAVVGRGPVIA